MEGRPGSLRPLILMVLGFFFFFSGRVRFGVREFGYFSFHLCAVLWLASKRWDLDSDLDSLVGRSALQR